MKHPIGITAVAVIGIVLGVIILGGVAYYMSSTSATNDNTNANLAADDVMKGDKNVNDVVKDDITIQDKKINTSTEEGKTTENQAQGSSANPGEYTDYTSSAFQAASGKQRVLFFYAAWCPTCRPADANITANVDQLPDDVVVFRTNYDTEDALKAQYGITYQHTFVLVDENGNVIQKWNGGDIDKIIENVS
jgi:thioredoxin 1